MERRTRKHTTTAQGQARSSGRAANPVPDDTEGPWVIDGFDITIYAPTDSNPYYQVVWYEDGRRRTTTGGTTYRKAELKADTIARRLDVLTGLRPPHGGKFRIVAAVAVALVLLVGLVFPFIAVAYAERSIAGPDSAAREERPPS